MDKIVSYVMAPADSYYAGQVMRRVTSRLDTGQQLILSETTTGMELDEFQQKHPNEPVDGQKGLTLRDELSYMTDEQLAEMGLTRAEGTEKKVRPEQEKEVLEPSYTYPYPTGYGWYMLSSGLKAKGKAEATRREDAIKAGNPDPEDLEALTKD
jgi:hypothetical protein